MMKRALMVMAAVLATAGVARAQGRIALDEVVGSWQADDTIQYVELRMLDGGQNGIANVAALVFDDATGSTDTRRVLFFTQNVVRGIQDAKILVASTKARDLASVQPDFLLPAGFLQPKNGRVCYAVNTANGLVNVDCVAYGEFKGDNGTLGPPTTRTPDNRALQRIAYTGRTRADWTSVLNPVLEDNVGATGVLPATLCGDELISQGEECDGKALAGATCASLGFAKGTLACLQCHFDTKDCTSCGNDAINGKEECDGDDLGERTCESLGYTGGTLACSETCTLAFAECDPTFFVPGGGPPKTECLGEWLVTNTVGGPNAKGKVAARQTCKDGTPGCDGDGAANGTCLFTVAPCFSIDDARFPKCPATAVSGWSLLGKTDPADPTVAALLASAAALGPSTVDGLTVAFSPALAQARACGASVQVPVAAGKKLALRARTAGPQGKPKDVDVLRLSCTR
jgi:hypothetical protein